MKNKKYDYIKNNFIISLMGYILIILSSLILYFGARVFTGFFPSFNFFLLALIDCGLHDINIMFILAPLLSSFIFSFIFSFKNGKLSSALSLSAYYIIINLIFIIRGSDNFSAEVFIPWSIWIFLLGYFSQGIFNKFNARHA
jgi:hypothetical protein